MAKWILLVPGGMLALGAACSEDSRAGTALAAPPAASQAVALCAATQPDEPAPPASADFAQAVCGQLERLAEVLARPAGLDERALEPLTAFVFRCRPLRPRALVQAWSNDVVTLFQPAPEEMAGVDHVGREGLRKALLALVEPLRASGGEGIDVELVLGTATLDAAGGECTVRYRASARPARGAVQQNASWRCRWAWSRTTDALPLLESIELDRYEELRAEPGPAGFADCSAAVLGGVPAWHADLLHGQDHFARRLDRALGAPRRDHGLAVGDVNGDGLDDLFVGQPGGLPNRLLVQRPDGSALEVTREAGLDHLDATGGALLVDLDGDGDQDLCAAIGPGLAFFANNGQGAFAPSAWIDAPAAGALTAADHDLDGDLDVFACGLGLLRNAGGLRFEDVTGAVGLDGGGAAAAWEDYDDDGDPDLCVSSERGLRLWRNERDGERVVFADVALDAGVTSHDGVAAGASWADVDGDGLMDLLTGGSRLLRNASGTFRDVGAALGIDGASAGARFVEIDGDGWPDLLVPAGAGGVERGRCLLRAGERFADATRLLGLDCAGGGTAACVDWDQDGDLDLWLTSRAGPRLRFLRNDLGRAPGALALRLVGGRANRDAVGARVRLALATPGGSALRIDGVRAGDGYLAQSSKWLHFALGEGTRIESVDVRWPGGVRERFAGVEPGGRYELVEGRGQAVAWRGGAKRTVVLAPSSPVVPAPDESARVVLAARPPFVGLRYESTEGLLLPLAPREMPLLVLLWRGGCAGCSTQLAHLAGSHSELAAQPLEILALAVDEPGARAAAQAALDAVAWPHGAGYAPPELTRALDVLQRTLVERADGLQLPASFLVDRSGSLALVTTGLLAPEQLARDLELLDLPAHARRDSAALFPGRWLTPAPGVDFAGLEAAFRGAGLAEVADAVAQARLAASAARPVNRR